MSLDGTEVVVMEGMIARTPDSSASDAVKRVPSVTVDLPGTFAGGGLLLDTNAYPVDFEMKRKVSTGLDSATAFRDVNTQPGGALGFLGYDDGARVLQGGGRDPAGRRLLRYQRHVHRRGRQR